MKIKYSLMAITLAAFCLSSCSSDDNEVKPAATPELQMKDTSLKVKAGAENRQEIEIVQGGGTYNAFAIDATIVKVTQENGKIYVEGLQNGKTDVVVSDAAGQYRKFRVSVYMYDTLAYTMAEGSDDPASSTNKAFMGDTKSFKVQLTQHNGNCSAVSNNDNVTASVDDETGMITINAKAGVEPYEAIVTVKDNVEAAPDMEIKVAMDTEPYYYNAYPDAKDTDYNMNRGGISYATNTGYSGCYFYAGLYLNDSYTNYGISGYKAGNGYTYDIRHEGNHHVLDYKCDTNSWGYLTRHRIGIEFDGELVEGAKYPATFHGQYTYGPADSPWYNTFIDESSKCQVELYKVGENGKFAAMVSYVNTEHMTAHRAFIIAPMPE